jgi:phosphoribosyl-ATP pyrophosphohydrolase/phosphoribosyl-AMP cyclohydrolase
LSGLDALDWDKSQGLLPAIVQDHMDGAVLMLGYMNREALAVTQASGRVTFYSRSKQRLWTKGETSGHFLEVRAIAADCDGDALLILAHPLGPACHRGTPAERGARVRLSRRVDSHHPAAHRCTAAGQLHGKAPRRGSPAHRAESG